MTIFNRLGLIAFLESALLPAGASAAQAARCRSVSCGRVFSWSGSGV
jgi:hypothetical protein